MKVIQPDRVFNASVIITTQRRRGDGRNSLSPIRVITEVFNLEGDQIAEYDPCASEVTFTAQDLVDFHKWAKENQQVSGSRDEYVLAWIHSIRD